MNVLIETQAIRREFGDTLAVDDVSLKVEQGAVFALVGPNGAGKSTLLRMLGGLLEPSGGSALILGHDVRESTRQVRRGLGFLPEVFGLYETMTARDYLKYFCLAYGLPAAEVEGRIAEVLALVKLSERAGQPIETFSRGMRQRLGIARTLVHDPKLLLLDEPATGLDTNARLELQALFKDLAARGKTLLISSHILAELQDYCTHVAVLDRGRLVYSGPVSEVRSRLGRGRRIRVRAAAALDLARRLAKENALVGAWSGEGRQAEFDFKGDDAELAALLKTLVTAGVPVSAFSELGGTIQDSYLALMEKESA